MILSREKIMQSSYAVIALSVLLITLTVGWYNAYALPETTVSVIPDYILVATGESFTVEIVVSGVSDLASWQLALEYNCTTLNCTRVWLPEDNVFANKQTYLVEDHGKTSTDNLFLIYGVISLEGGVNIPDVGNLCKINFTVKEAGFTALRIATESNPIVGSVGGAFENWETILLSSDLNKIPFDENSGTVTSGGVNIPPSANFEIITLTSPPKNAKLIYLKTVELPVFFVEEPVLFNASSSKDANGNITSYEWNFGDGNITIVDIPSVTHVYENTSLTLTVTLRVWDNENASSNIVSQSIQVGIILILLDWTPYLGVPAALVVVVAVISIVRRFSKKKLQAKTAT